MEKGTDELSLGEQEVARRLDAIRNSKKVQQFIAGIKEDAENSGMSVKFKSRIKENQSAINKFKKYKEQSGIEDPEMWDSCGMMLIVEDEEEIYEFVRYMEEKLTTRENGLSDYVQNPKAGYRSVHMYSTFEADGITVPSEIQIKTEAMSIAQDTVHDSVYKLQDLPYEKRNELSTAMFPIFEKSADADKLERRGDLEGAAQLRSEVEQARSDNAQLLSENQAVVDKVWLEYGKVLFTHHNIDEIEGTLFLNKQGLTKEDKAKVNQQLQQSLDKLFEYYKGNVNDSVTFPSISGNPGIDYAIHQLNTMDYSQFVKEFKAMTAEQQKAAEESKKEEPVAGISDFASLDESVTPEMRKSMMSEISRAMTERTTDRDMDTERE